MKSLNFTDILYKLYKSRKKLVISFPGQSCQFLNMGMDFYEKDENSKKIIDLANEYVKKSYGWSILDVICNDAEALNNTIYSQICIFVISTAIFSSFINKVDFAFCNDAHLNNISYINSSNSIKVNMIDLVDYCMKNAIFSEDAISDDYIQKKNYQNKSSSQETKYESLLELFKITSFKVDFFDDILNEMVISSDILKSSGPCSTEEQLKENDFITSVISSIQNFHNHYNNSEYCTQNSYIKEGQSKIFHSQNFNESNEFFYEVFAFTRFLQNISLFRTHLSNHIGIKKLNEMNFAEKFNYLDIFKCIDDDFLNIFHDSCDSDYSTPESINSYKDIFMRNLNNYADFFSLDSNKLRNFYNFLLNFEVFFSGHSLGEYSALCAAGVLNFFDCIDILYNRSKLMSEAEDGGMVAIIGSTEDAEKLINHGQLFGICVKANQNCGGQIVLSGSVKVIDEVIKFALEIGVKAIRLSVSGAFHSPLMLDAQNSLKDVLINKVFHDPISGFLSSSTYFNDVMFFGNSIKESMFQQMTHGVNWKNLMNRIVNGDFGTGDLILIQKVKDCLHRSDYFKGVELSSNTDIPNHFENKTLFIEIGPGKILSGLANKHKYDNFNFSLNANELYKHLW